ncbi:uncharacterized protein F4822DRAFT_445743 [Hypoxylon trugodes]|uniref:uncharacterized protein n=1 Tax=Hypoxylon trugodes TaxID=326681 RepID=UPI00219EFFAF|nr:uncharacterized protein F4822DRAFT_445743 [Hypoxylon trugodes]KAI1385900.1 hypothetical protein F4822DRAFT_445743 [Hypoxylon trugodes]
MAEHFKLRRIDPSQLLESIFEIGLTLVQRYNKHKLGRPIETYEDMERCYPGEVCCMYTDSEIEVQIDVYNSLIQNKQLPADIFLRAISDSIALTNRKFYKGVLIDGFPEQVDSKELAQALRKYEGLTRGSYLAMIDGPNEADRARLAPMFVGLKNTINIRYDDPTNVWQMYEDVVDILGEKDEWEDFRDLLYKYSDDSEEEDSEDDSPLYMKCYRKVERC